ncbi:hypothetical protein RhiJN_06577 [Ceratobasidium sp. AG-Ba]|nr:hypothetical protein RhiJN_06577 [Ceratobasidium sp. AG-Ba]QRW07491.1 hypothetical protein RhiLY_06490 [Ceratobasidium sp. AG-Ba]
MSTEASTSSPGIVLPTSLPIPEGYEEALPPWTLDAEAWWILPPVPLPWQAKVLPKGALDPFEEERYRDLQATYTGGLGTIQLIRYHTSPVGPYDELLYVPGNMSYKTGPSSTISGLSVTRIYVSSTASVVNGTAAKLQVKSFPSFSSYHLFAFDGIGNIPKQLARFEFTKEDESDPLSPVIASVYPALLTSTSEFSPEPIFSARLVPSRRIPNFPLDLARVPHFLLDPRLFQAPLTNSGQGNGLVGTEKWCTIIPSYSGEVRVMYPEPRLSEGKFGDGVGFPDVQPMSVGLWWPTAKILFTPPVILNVFGQPVAEEDKKTK